MYEVEQKYPVADVKAIEDRLGRLGASWRGAFVGGDLLVDAITDGERPIYGNFKGGSRFPEGLDL